jgi:hypothetical protein
MSDEIDELTLLAAARTKTQARNRKVFAVVGVCAVVLGTSVWYRDWKHKGQVQAKLDFFEKWAQLDKRETASLFHCVMASEIDISQVANAEQIRQKIEAAYRTQQKTFADYLLIDCVPKLERARQAIGGLADAPAEFLQAAQKYTGVFPKLQDGLEDYAQKLKGRETRKGFGTLVQEAGTEWHNASRPTPQAVAFEKFMHCAIPGLASMKDAQQLLEFLADACYKKDPAAFRDKVKSECGPLLEDPDPKAKPSSTWALSLKRFYETEARQMQAWESCSTRADKNTKAGDLQSFLTAVGEYTEARSAMVKAARAIQGGG